jgi:hypothetical protein
LRFAGRGEPHALYWTEWRWLTGTGVALCQTIFKMCSCYHELAYDMIRRQCFVPLEFGIWHREGSGTASSLRRWRGTCFSTGRGEERRRSWPRQTPLGIRPGHPQAMHSCPPTHSRPRLRLPSPSLSSTPCSAPSPEDHFAESANQTSIVTIPRRTPLEYRRQNTKAEPNRHTRVPINCDTR